MMMMVLRAMVVVVMLRMSEVTLVTIHTAPFLQCLQIGTLSSSCSTQCRCASVARACSAYSLKDTRGYGLV